MSDNNKKSAPKGDDAGQAEVQRISDEAAEKGYFGTLPPGPPNEAYSLESGPDAPTHAEELEFVAKAAVDNK